MLREQAAEADALRRLPDRTVEALVEAGFHRVYQPARYGGCEMDYALQIELGYALGRGSASAAWVALFYATHPFVVGMMEPEAQDDVWKQTPDALLANAFFTPATTCRPVEGGFVLDGTWIISSGVTHADWNNLNVLVPRESAPPEHRFMLVPRADYRILDDWRAAGLAGTGSHSIVLDQVFVPEHRTLKTFDCRGGPTPGSRDSESPLYRLPLMAVFPAGAAAPAPGIAQGALDHLVETLAPAPMSRARASLSCRPSRCAWPKPRPASTRRWRSCASTAPRSTAWRVPAPCPTRCSARAIGGIGAMPCACRRARSTISIRSWAPGGSTPITRCSAPGATYTRSPRTPHLAGTSRPSISAGPRSACRRAIRGSERGPRTQAAKPPGEKASRSKLRSCRKSSRPHRSTWRITSSNSAREIGLLMNRSPRLNAP